MRLLSYYYRDIKTHGVQPDYVVAAHRALMGCNGDQFSIMPFRPAGSEGTAT